MSEIRSRPLKHSKFKIARNLEEIIFWFLTGPINSNTSGQKTDLFFIAVINNLLFIISNLNMTVREVTDKFTLIWMLELSDKAFQVGNFFIEHLASSLVVQDIMLLHVMKLITSILVWLIKLSIVRRLEVTRPQKMFMQSTVIKIKI